MGHGDDDAKAPAKPPIPPAPQRQVFLMPVNMIDNDIALDDPTNGTNSTEANKVLKKNARRNYGMHSCNTTLLPQSSKHSRAWLYRRFYEPIELQVETLSAVAARLVLAIWYLTVIAALVLSVIPEAQWTIKDFCDLSKSAKSQNLKHLDRWQSTCLTVTASSGPSAVAGAFDVQWTGTGYDGNQHGLDRFRRMVISLPTPTGMTAKKQTYALTARIEAVELSENVSVFYDLEVVCRRGKPRCDVNRLPEELLMTDTDGSDVSLQLLNLPVDLAAPLSPTLTGQTTVPQKLAAVGLTFQKKSYTLGTIVWRYIFMFLTLIHFIRFLANRKFTSTLYEQSWVLMLQLALFWYMDPLIALNVTMHPVPSVLSFIEFRLPTYFIAITLAFMFAVMTASMTWKQRSEEPTASYLRKVFILSKNVYAPPNWTKLVSVIFIIVVFVLDIIDASVYQVDWISGSNSNSTMSPIYWTVIALLLLGGVVCLGILYYLQGYLGSKSYLESRPQQLACRVFLTVFLSVIVFYIIHCFVFYLHYNRSYSAVYARQPFIQFPALLVAPILVNIMTLVYTTRNRNESVPVLASDQRWLGIVWPDSWYRWLARHGGSQYIFSTEAEETNFYRIQFQFRCRQLMAHLKKKQGRSRRGQRQRRHAYTDEDEALTHTEGGDQGNHTHADTHNDGHDDDPHDNSFGSFTLSALPSFVLDGLRNPENLGAASPNAFTPGPSGAQTAGDAADSSLPLPQPLDAGKDNAHDPASYRTPPPLTHAQTVSTFSPPPAAWGASADPLAQSSRSAGGGGGKDVGMLPGKLGRRLLNMDRFSTYYLPPERQESTATGATSTDAGDPLAQTYSGARAGPGGLRRDLCLSETVGDGTEGSASLRRRHVVKGTPSDLAVTRHGGMVAASATSAGFTVVGPARHRSMLQQRSTALQSTERSASLAQSRNRSFAGAGDSLLGSPLSPQVANASRWSTAINATVFMNALHQAPAGRRDGPADDHDEVVGANASAAGAGDDGGDDTYRDAPVHNDGLLSGTDGGAGARASMEDHLRSYEVQFAHSSDEDTDDWWQAAAVHGGAQQDKNVGFFRGIANTVGSAVQAVEWHLIVNPVRKFEQLQSAAIDAAYRPFDASSYLPFFNLETAIDCYNMSWEAYGVKESAGDAAIETGLKLVPENVPATVKHGVSKVFCGCCAASESEDDEERTTTAAGARAPGEDINVDDEDDVEESDGEDGAEHRFPEDIPEEEDPVVIRRKESLAVQQEAAERRAAVQAAAAAKANKTATAQAAGDTAVAAEAPPAAFNLSLSASSPSELSDAATRVPADANVLGANALDAAVEPAETAEGANNNATTTSVPVAAGAAAPAEKEAPASTLYPINVGKYGYELLFVSEIRDVQLIIAKMNVNEPEHLNKAPRIIISFRGTANLSNAKYDVNLHRVVWKAMERAEEEDEVRSAAGGRDGSSIATTAAASSLAAYTGCKACWKSCVRKSSWRPTVHAGFLSLWRAMEGTVLRELKKALVGDANTVYRLFTTGHSLGGALAALASYSITRMLLRLDYPIPEVTSYTYGQPRIGNRTFRNAYNKAVPRSFRVMNESDMVVTMTTFGGYHVGIEVDVDRNGNFIVKPTEIEKLFPPTKGRGLSVMNHLMSNYAISMNAIAKARACPARALMTYETADPEKRRREKISDRKLNIYPASEGDADPDDYPNEDEDGDEAKAGTV